MICRSVKNEQSINKKRCKSHAKRRKYTYKVYFRLSDIVSVIVYILAIIAITREKR